MLCPCQLWVRTVSNLLGPSLLEGRVSQSMLGVPASCPGAHPVCLNLSSHHSTYGTVHLDVCPREPRNLEQQSPQLAWLLFRFCGFCDCALRTGSSRYLDGPCHHDSQVPGCATRTICLCDECALNPTVSQLHNIPLKPCCLLFTCCPAVLTAGGY
jgi:hypothetical protein